MSGRSFSIAMIAMVLIALGCSNGGGNPTAPGSDLTAGTVLGAPTQTHLWGYYDVYIDIPTQTATATLDRSIMYAANVTQFLNGNPANLGFNIIGTPTQPTYIDVDIDVTIKHPIVGLTAYNGYDVRGIFMGNGHGSLKYSAKLKPPKLGTDQYMLPDPIDGFGGADGYTRWFNKLEFTTPGLFGYTPGMYASGGYSPTASLCPYKYFADGLGKTANLTTWLKANPTKKGLFASGSQNTRNYYLRFPTPAPNVQFGYAVVANWKGEKPSDHPAPAPEALAANLTDTSDVYYISPAHNGGDLKLQFDLFGWKDPPSEIVIESTVLLYNHVFTVDEMIPIGSGANYSTYYCDIPATSVTGANGNEYWVIAKYSAYNYKNTFGVTNLAGNDPLAAFFRYNLAVATNIKPVCDLVVVTPMPKFGWGSQDVEFDASGSSDPEDTLTFTWDFDGDNIYSESPDDSYTGPPDKPVHTYTEAFNGLVHVKVTDSGGLFAICEASVDVTPAAKKNINIYNSAGVGTDIAMDPMTGDVLVLYSNGTVRRYHYDEAFTSFTVATSGSTMFKWLDVAPNGYWIIGGGDANYIRDRHFNAADGYITEGVYGPWGANVPNSCDVCCMFDVGSRALDHVHIFGNYDWILVPSPHYEYYTRWWGREDTAFTVAWGYDFMSLNPSGVGAAIPYYGWIRGMEASPSGDFIWEVEYNDCYAAKFNVSTAPITYANNSFGTGIPTDTDIGVNNPRDITVAKTGPDKYFILDRKSTGAFVIKGFIDNGVSTLPLTSFTQDPAWAYAPTRLDGAPNLERMIVLMTAGANTRMSLFESGELP